MYKNKKVCVVIPAYNEEILIGGVLEAMPDYIDGVIVVDDGSSDNTAKIAKEKGAFTVSHTRNKGVGAAFQTGIKKALELSADIAVNIDADGQFDPNDITKLIQHIEDGSTDFVTASRFKEPAYYPEMTKAKFIGNKLMSFLISKLCGKRFYDVSCGFRAYSRDTLLKLNLFGDFTYTQETFLDLVFKGVTMMEIPIKVRGVRKEGKSRVASNLFKYSYQASKIFLKAFRDYRPLVLFGFISLLAFLLSSFFGVGLITHYIVTGKFTPHKWAGFVSGFFIILTILLLMIGFILDMFVRMRRNQEESLFYLRKK